ncbi:S1C family serine protease [Streptomyces sp. NPDC020681]|uniref:S1C family serine protease n=1 Tax=Streptomyces sp. NPDC020681 TaxID=3365083 RepID=UPI0037AE2AA2
MPSRLSIFVIAVLLAVLSVWGTAGSATAQSALDDSDVTPKEIVDLAAPATVHLGGPESSGTGFIYDAEQGLIVTNAHVVQGQAALQARIEGRAPVAVQVLGIDPCEDVAVVRLVSPQSDLKQLKFGDSDAVKNADEVHAFGYPSSFADPNSRAASTSGVVQASEAPASPGPSYPNFPATIRHSAKVDPSGSGGPLLNARGEAIGINTLRNSDDVERQFYAISGNRVQSMLDRLAAGESRNDPGWELVALSDPAFPASFPDLVAALEMQNDLVNRNIDGMYVLSVDSNSAADRAHFEGGDLITTMKDVPVATMGDVCAVLQSASSGDAVATEGLYITSGGSEHEYTDPWSADLVLE